MGRSVQSAEGERAFRIHGLAGRRRVNGGSRAGCPTNGRTARWATAPLRRRQELGAFAAQETTLPRLVELDSVRLGSDNADARQGVCDLGYDIVAFASLARHARVLAVSAAFGSVGLGSTGGRGV
jgi:hypothetical protein